MPYELSILICQPGCDIISNDTGNGAKLVAVWDQETGITELRHKNRRLLSRLQVAFRDDSSFETSHLILNALSRKQLGYRSVIQGIYVVSEDQLTFFYSRAFFHNADSGTLYSAREDLVEESSFANSTPLTLSLEHGKMTWHYPSPQKTG
jgi:hypothetical protein